MQTATRFFNNLSSIKYNGLSSPKGAFNKELYNQTVIPGPDPFGDRQVLFPSFQTGPDTIL